MISLRRVVFLSFYLIVGLSIAHFYYDQDFGLDFLSKEDYSLNENLEINFLSSRGDLYIKNYASENIKLDHIKFGDTNCEINSDLMPGVNAVEINHCIKQKISTKMVLINDIPIELIYVNYNSFSNSKESTTQLESEEIKDEMEDLIIIDLKEEGLKEEIIEEKVSIIKSNQIKKENNEYNQYLEFEENEDIKDEYIEEIKEEVKLILEDNITSKNQIQNFRSTLSVVTKTFDLDCSSLEGGDWISIPGNSDLGTNDFCVMKYEAKCVEKKDGSTCNPEVDTVISQPENTPWTNVNQSTAKFLCENLGTGYHLITNPKWTTIARIIEVDSYNWADNTIGSSVKSGGGIYRGNVFLNDAISCGNNTILDGTQLKSCDASGRNKRALRVADKFIWDLAGNIDELVDGTCSRKEWYENGWKEWTNSLLSFERNDLGPLGNYDSKHGIGRYYGCKFDGLIPLRGGNKKDGDFTGLYSITKLTDPSEPDIHIGFRCVYSP